MKHAILFIVIAVFSFNIIVLNALAAPCAHDSLTGTKIEKSAKNLPDCHKKAEQHNPSKSHCKGICFCQHAQVSGFVMPATGYTLPTYNVAKGQPDAPVQLLNARNTAPDIRPPIFIS